MKKIFISSFLVFALSLLADKITVEPANAAIVLPPQADGAVQFAGQELQRLIQLKTGVQLPLGETAPQGAYVFRFGTPEGVLLKSEEARWEVTAKQTRLYGDSSPIGRKVELKHVLESRFKSGDLSAVYDFAEKQLGILFLAPGPLGTACEPSKTLKLELGQRSWSPGQLVIRRLRSDISPARYKQYMGLEKFPWGPMSKVHPAFRMTEEQYLQQYYATALWLKQQRMGASTQLNYGHAFTTWWARYGKDHPEYFALCKGKREPSQPAHPDYVKMCLSNEAFQEQMLKEWQAKGAGKYLNVCENDGGGFCECEACRAWDPVKPDGTVWDGSMTDRYIHFANVMVGKARKIKPDTQACFYAYSAYCEPPIKEKVDANIVIGMVTSMLNCENARKTFEGWAAAGAKQLFLRPNDQHINTGLPMGFEKTLFEHFQMGYKKGIISTDYDQLHGFWDITGLADYVLARAHIEPEQPFDHWVDEYCSAYGPAAPIVKAYFDYYRTAIWEQRVLPNRQAILERGRFGNFRRGLMWDLAKYYTIKDFDTTDAILAQAESLPLSATQRARFDELKLANTHARLTFLATIAPKGDRTAAQTLLDFRIANRDKLNINWLYLTRIEQYCGDTTKIASLLK